MKEHKLARKALEDRDIFDERKKEQRKMWISKTNYW